MDDDTRYIIYGNNVKRIKKDNLTLLILVSEVLIK